MSAAACSETFGGRSVADVLTRAAEILGRPIPEDRGQRAAQQLMTRFQNELKPIAHAADVVASLPYPRCVCSSSAPDRLLLSLEVTGLAPLFTPHVYSATQVARGKPAPDLFLFAARNMGTAPSEAVVVEDSLVGIAAARAAGMSSIGFTGASHASEVLATQLVAAGADTVVSAMTELPAAVAEVIRRNSARSRRRV
jgi:HAD superfamily hydrolase (TIGR01509 family)